MKISPKVKQGAKPEREQCWIQDLFFFFTKLDKFGDICTFVFGFFTTRQKVSFFFFFLFTMEAFVVLSVHSMYCTEEKTFSKLPYINVYKCTVGQKVILHDKNVMLNQ